MDRPLRVLVVDDEVNIAELIAMALRYEGFEVATAHTGGKAVTAAKTFRPDSVVLDMMLPDFDGMEVLRRMRASDPGVPVLFLTARDSVEDRVAGLTAGGDDYVTKPFSLEEVVARLRALMRRTGAHQPGSSSVLVVGDLMMDEDSREVTRDGAGHLADGDRVRAAAVPDAQPAARAVEGADPRPSLELRLRRPGQRRGALHLLPAQEDRRRPRADDPHHARCRLRAEARELTWTGSARSPRDWCSRPSCWWLWCRLLIGTATTLALRNQLVDQLDAKVSSTAALPARVGRPRPRWTTWAARRPAPWSPTSPTAPAGQHARRPRLGGRSSLADDDLDRLAELPRTAQVHQVAVDGRGRLPCGGRPVTPTATWSADSP